jgi:hypothetical protein
MTEELNTNLLTLYATFPRIAKGIELFWGNKEFPDYINKLLADGRNDRQGFPAEVTTALFALQKLHAVSFPEYEDDQDGWMSTSF